MPQVGEPRRVPGSLPTSGPCPTGSSWSAARSSLAAGRGPPGDHGHADASVGPARPAPASSVRRQPRADDQPVVDTVGGDHADSGRPGRVAARGIGALDELTRFGHRRRGNARIADTGCPDARTPIPDSGHPDAWTPTPDTGHRSRDIARVDTGRSHRTLDAGCCWGPDRLTRHGQLRISWAITPSGCPLGRRTVFPRTAPAALGVPCRLGGAATCQCANLPIALSGSCSGASPAKRRLGALLSLDDFGSRVERQAHGQVLWRAGLQRAGNVSSAAVW